MYHGPYGRLFDELEPWRPRNSQGVPIEDGEALTQWCTGVAKSVMVESLEQNGSPTAPQDVDQVQMNFLYGSSIPAGYTYFGQFIDHDITFDPTSSLQRQNDPAKLYNFRTPRLDLDSLYGRGPDDQPYLFDTDLPPGQAKFLIGTIPGTTIPDLARNTRGRAVIGDPRNDENSIVSQLQVAFLCAHNTLVDRALARGVERPFSAARTTLRWLYQWVAWHDFLGRVVDRSIHHSALERKSSADGRTVWTRSLQDVYDWRRHPFIPVEFSVAAYRFGHSMVRSKYVTNLRRGFDEHLFSVPILDNSPETNGDDLRGFRPMTLFNAIEWDWFLPMTSSAGEFPQKAHRIDTKIANALAFLHEGPAGAARNVLASRNILRGIQMQLPSGPDVAAKLGFEAIDMAADEPGALWYYVLKEAETVAGGERLGPVGSVIVASVFAGLLAGDPQSWINVQPAWTPDVDPLLSPGIDNFDTADNPVNWQLASIIRIAGVPTTGDEFDFWPDLQPDR